MTIRSHPSTDTYRENWDRVFGPKNLHTPMVPGWDLIVTPEWQELANLSPEQVRARRHTESLGSHPAAD